MTKTQTYGLSLLSAFLLWLAWPPISYTAPLLLIGLVPLFIALHYIVKNEGANKGKRIFLTAGLTFLVWNTASIYWVYNAVSAFNNPIVAFFVSLIPYGLGALLMTFAFWLWYQLQSRTNKYIGYAGLVCFYIAQEFLHESWDLAFPWMNLGNGFADLHQLAQWYAYTGVYGGTLWVLLSNILAFEAYQAFIKKEADKHIKTPRPMGTPLEERKATSHSPLPQGWSNTVVYKQKHQSLFIKLFAWLLVVIIPLGISLKMYNAYQEKPMPINVVVVQPNIDPYQKYESLSANEQLRVLTHLSDSIGQPNTEYFIWPETAISDSANEDKIRDNPDYLRAQQFLSKYKNGTLITGIESYKLYNDKQTLSAAANPNGGFYDKYNAAVQIENSADVQFYHKSKLVPGPEKLPFPKITSFLAPVFSGLGGSVSGYGWQEQPGVFYSQIGVGVAPVICYESIWGSWIGQAVKNGAQLIAIITNDGWWGNTSGKDQHLLYAKLRAIENRRCVVRSANTGISGFINQRGDILKQTKWWTRTAIKADVNLNDDLTFYTKNGDLIAQLATILAILLALIIPFKKYRIFKWQKIR
jgi:apolipoprotein N-acyltransferase